MMVQPPQKVTRWALSWLMQEEGRAQGKLGFESSRWDIRRVRKKKRKKGRVGSSADRKEALRDY